MADVISNPSVQFGGDTGDLDSAVAHAKAQVKALDRAIDNLDKKRKTASASAGGGAKADTGVTPPKQTTGAETVRPPRAKADRPERAKADRDRGPGLIGSAVQGAAAGVSFGLSELGLSGLDGIKQLGVDAVKSAADMEVLRLSLDTMLGSAAKADRLIGEVKGFAAESPLSFADSTESAKQLLAIGVAADQVVPTLRALTDVSAGLSDGKVATKLKFVAKAYSDVMSAQAMTGQELRQFSEAGVPIIEALAKAMDKPKESIKDMVSAGQVGPAEVVKAFRGMTEAGGKFANMSEKYSKTTAGAFDRLGDAWQTLKAEVGGVLIEELGLKAAAKDAEAFTDRIRSGIDSIRPAVRFVGDLAKGAAQVANEFGKAALVVGDLSFAGIKAAVPELAAAGAELRAVVSGLANFKLDPTAVVRFAAVTAKAVAAGASFAWGSLSAVGGRLRAEIVDPLVGMATSLKATFDDINQVFHNIGVARRMAGRAFGEDDELPLKLRSEVRAAAKLTDPLYAKDVPADVAKFRDRADEFRDKADNAHGPDRARLRAEDVQNRAHAEGLLKLHQSLKAPAGADANPAPAARAGGLGDRLRRVDLANPRDADRQARDFAGGPPAGAGVPKDAGAGPPKPGADAGNAAGGAGALDDAFALITGMADRMIAGLENEARRAEAAAGMAKVTAGVGPAADAAAAAVYRLSGGLVALGASARKGLQTPDDLASPAVRDAAKAANDEFKAKVDPVGDLRQKVKNLDTARDKNLIDKNVHALAVDKTFRDATSGLDVRPQLPQAAERGTVEAARLEAQFIGGQGGPASAEALLQQVVALLQQQLATSQTFAPTVTAAVNRIPAAPPTAQLPNR